MQAEQQTTRQDFIIELLYESLHKACAILENLIFIKWNGLWGERIPNSFYWENVLNEYGCPDTPELVSVRGRPEL